MLCYNVKALAHSSCCQAPSRLLFFAYSQVQLSCYIQIVKTNFEKGCHYLHYFLISAASPIGTLTTIIIGSTSKVLNPARRHKHQEIIAELQDYLIAGQINLTSLIVLLPFPLNRSIISIYFHTYAIWEKSFSPEIYLTCLHHWHAQHLRYLVPVGAFFTLIKYLS